MNVYKLTSMVPSDRHDEAALVMGKLIEDWAASESVTIAAVEVIEGEIAGGKAPTPPGWTMLVAQAIGDEQPTADDDSSMDVVVEDTQYDMLTFDQERRLRWPKMSPSLTPPTACPYCGALPGRPHRTLVFHPA